MDTKVVEQCRISPSHSGAAEQSLPLVYFDMQSFHLYVKTLLFYNFPSSKPHFFHTILPNLKNSLSLALKHFLPLAGNIIFPLNSGMPVSRYSSYEEDSVSLTVAVSDSDYFLLTGNQPKDADDLHNLVTEISSAVCSSESIKFPVIALQITLFPSQGICIGITYHHAICDGAAFLCFLYTWASINKFNDDKHIKKPGTAHVSSYTAVCARVWSCLAAGAGEGASDDEIEYLLMPVDCRAKLRPPLPMTYFGNCLTCVIAESTYGRLRGNGGMVAAAEAIEEALHKTLENDKGILDGCVERYLRIFQVYGKGRRLVAVTGSTRFDLYASDCGLGEIKKLELNIHMDGCISLSKSKEGVEVGITLPKLEMDGFASFFNRDYDMQQPSKL